MSKRSFFKKKSWERKSRGRLTHKAPSACVKRKKWKPSSNPSSSFYGFFPAALGAFGEPQKKFQAIITAIPGRSGSSRIWIFGRAKRGIVPPTPLLIIGVGVRVHERLKGANERKKGKSMCGKIWKWKKFSALFCTSIPPFSRLPESSE